MRCTLLAYYQTSCNALNNLDKYDCITWVTEYMCTDTDINIIVIDLLFTVYHPHCYLV